MYKYLFLITGIFWASEKSSVATRNGIQHKLKQDREAYIELCSGKIAVWDKKTNHYYTIQKDAFSYLHLSFDVKSCNTVQEFKQFKSIFEKIS